MTYRETAPSGVKVTSEVPLLDNRWQDLPILHVLWSYTAWLTLTLKEVGVTWPRALFNKYWNTRPPAP